METDHGMCEGSIILLGCFSFISGTGQLHVIEGKMNSSMCQEILQKNMLPSVKLLKLPRNGCFSETVTRSTLL